jgi:sigma-B regulation protein RsbU (phosphoserine phosphatase)
VSVVVRQGLQYALAKNGVRVLQFLLLFAVGLGTLFTINNYGRDISRQITFIVVGVALVPLIDFVAKRLIVWVDRRFFREAYNAEQILSDLSEDVRTMIETKPLLETVSSRISESLHVPQVALLLKNGVNFQPAYALGYKNAPDVSLNENNATIEKLKTNEPLVIYQDDQDSWINDEGQTAERENLRELNSQLLLPFGAKNELSGLISLSPKLSDSPYTPTDLRLLKSVAAQTGLALENSRLTQVIVSEAAQKERINRELEIAREVQERLFPQELPKIEGLDYFGACRSALDVGGDYYDFIELPENKFGIAIGDISGKGIGASLMMASLQASLRGQAIHFKSDLAGLMKQINSLVYEASTSNRYATFFYAQYEPPTKKLSYVNAGHNPPFLIRRSGEVLRLEDGGAVVGMLPSMLVNYKQGEIELQTGDLLVGYTDGISEAMNPQEEEWSEDAMLERLKTVSEKSAVEILPFIVHCADEFASGAKQHDDMTMIVVKVI